MGGSSSKNLFSIGRDKLRVGFSAIKTVLRLHPGSRRESFPTASEYFARGSARLSPTERALTAAHDSALPRRSRAPIQAALAASQSGVSCLARNLGDRRSRSRGKNLQ